MDLEKTLVDTQAEIRHMTEMLKEKDNIIESAAKHAIEQAEAKHTLVCQLKREKEAMVSTVQQYKNLVQKTSAAFLEYRNRMLYGEGGESSSDVLGMADEQSHTCWEQKLGAHQIINEFQKHWFAKYQECIKKITELATRMTYLKSEVQSLKGSRLIPDLNSGGLQL